MQYVNKSKKTIFFITIRNFFVFILANCELQYTKKFLMVLKKMVFLLLS
jgi:hypothetical protein